MITGDEKLRKVSDGIFQEADPPEGQSRPFEWRRRFNLINLPIKNVDIVTSCSVHGADFDWRNEDTKEPLGFVKANVSERTIITGLLDEEKMQDWLFFAVERRNEKGVFSVERASGETKISIRAGEPSEREYEISPGLYPGIMYRMNFDPGEDDVSFDLAVPQAHLTSLISALLEYPAPTVEVRAFLLSFTYEVDDALREHYHPRDIVISESAECFLSSVAVTSRIRQNFLEPASECDDDEGSDHSYHEEITPEDKAHLELMRVLSSCLGALNSLVAAIWVLIVVIAGIAAFQ